MSNHSLAVFGLVALSLLATVDTRATVTHAQPPAVPVGVSAQPVPADGLRVILLGTGVGPPVNLTKYGASTLVEAGGIRLLVDCGRGATMRLTEAGIPLGSVSRLFLTHLHSDHVMQIPDLLLAGWGGGGGTQDAARRLGPAGVAGHDGRAREGLCLRHPHAA